jgi:hypothetical protein
MAPKIAFLTACLEPGRDGVGDYARDLASACEFLGCDCALLALNDRYVEHASEERQSGAGGELDVLRLPATYSWEARGRRASAWLKQLAPDVVSLQFVPYGFHPKGIVLGLERPLRQLIAERRLHLMLHEIWIGASRRAPLRSKLIGLLQRQVLIGLIGQLRPAVIHTTNSAYAALLNANGVNAGLLPLCGNIPVAPTIDADWLAREFVALGLRSDMARSRDAVWRFGFFGSLYPVWKSEPLFTIIASAAQRVGRAVIITSVGRLGPGEDCWQDLRRRYAHQFSFAALGERPAWEVSAFLQGMDFGLATTPWQLIGKSGTTAAMIDHGLPVVVARDDEDYGIECPLPAASLLHKVDGNLSAWMLGVRPAPPRARLSEVARRFIADLAMGRSADTDAAVIIP